MGATNRPARVLGALVLAVAGLASVGADSAADVVDERTVIDKGHVDAIAPRLVDGEFRTLLKDSRESGNVVWREPTSVVMHLTPAGRHTIPDPAGGLEYVGAPGDVFHLIPQVQDLDVVWAGWNTEEFAPADLEGRLQLSLDEVEGPGELAVWAWSAFGAPLPRFDTRDGLPDPYDVVAGTHEHANWAFTEEGVYRMTFTFSATLASGEKVSDSQVFTMAVGDIDPDDVSLPGDDDGSSDGGTTDGGSSDGGTAGGGTDDGGTADGGSGGDGDTTDGGSGGTTAAGGGDGGSADDGGGAGGSSGGGTSGGTSGDAATGGTSGGDAGGAGVAGGSDDGTAKGGGLASTGSAGALPLAVTSAALIAAGAAGFVYVNRRRPRAARGDADADTPSP